MGLRLGSNDPTHGLGRNPSAPWSRESLYSSGQQFAAREKDEVDPGMREVYSQIKEKEHPGILERFGRTVGGLGYAVQNLFTAGVTSDPKYLTAATKNIVEMGGSLLTLDPITGLYSKFTGGGITEPWERPTFTESMENVGLPNLVPENKWARFGVDLAGGIFTDPLVYTRFAGKALKGLPESYKLTGKIPNDELLTAFMATNRGSRAIDEAARPIFETMKGVLRSRGKDLTPERYARLTVASRQKAARGLLDDALDLGDAKSLDQIRRSDMAVGTSFSKGILEGRGPVKGVKDAKGYGLEGLRQQGLLQQSGIGVDIPWPFSPLVRRITGDKYARYKPFYETSGHPIWGGGGFLDPSPKGLIGRSLPGVAYRGLRRVTPGTTEFIEKSLKWTGENIFKKGIYSIKGKAAQMLSTKAGDVTKQELYAANSSLAKKLKKELEGFSKEAGESIVNQQHRRSDELINAVDDILEQENLYKATRMPIGESWVMRGVPAPDGAARFYNVIYRRLDPSENVIANVRVKDRLIEVDPDVVLEQFGRKVWTGADGWYGVTAPKNAFLTRSEFEEFVIGAEIRRAEWKARKIYNAKTEAEKSVDLMNRMKADRVRKIKDGRFRLQKAEYDEQIEGFNKDLTKQIQSLESRGQIDSVRGPEGVRFRKRWKHIVEETAKRHGVQVDWENARDILPKIFNGHTGKITFAQKRALLKIAEKVSSVRREIYVDGGQFAASSNLLKKNIGVVVDKLFVDESGAGSALTEILTFYGKRKFIDNLAEATRLGHGEEWLDDFFLRSNMEELVHAHWAKKAKSLEGTWKGSSGVTFIERWRGTALEPGKFGFDDSWKSRAKADLRKVYPLKGRGSTTNNAKVRFLEEMIDQAHHLDSGEFFPMFAIADIMNPRVFKNLRGQKASDSVGWLRFWAGKTVDDLPSSISEQLKAAWKARRADEGASVKGFYAGRGVQRQLFDSPEAGESIARLIGIFTTKQNVGTFAHELAHSGWRTLLTKADIARVTKEAARMGVSNADEFFAVEFSRWFLERVHRTAGKNSLGDIFNKLWGKAQEIWNFIRVGKYRPSDSVVDIFKKMAPDLQQEGFAFSKWDKLRSMTSKGIKNASKHDFSLLKNRLHAPFRSDKVFQGLVKDRSGKMNSVIKEGVTNVQRRQVLADVMEQHPEISDVKIKKVLDFVFDYNKNILKGTQALGALPLDVLRLELLLYMPRQMSDQLANILTSIDAQAPSVIKEIIRKWGDARSRFEKGRTTKTSVDYEQSLIGIAKRLGITPTEPLMKTDLLDLLLSRGESFNRLKYDTKFLRRMIRLFGSPKMGRRILPKDMEAESISFAEESAKAFRSGKLEDVIDDYLSKVQHDQRRGIGTVFKADDVDWGQRAVRSAEEGGVFVNEPIGLHFPEDTVNIEKFVREYAVGLVPRSGASKSFAKVNQFIRQALTFGVLGIPFPSFTSRNIIGGTLQALTDPDMRASDAFRPMMAVLYDFPLTRWIAGKVPMSTKARGVSLMRRSLGDGEDAAKALAELKSLGLSAGGHRLESVVRLIKSNGLVGSDFATVERLRQQLMEPEAFIPMIMSMVGRGAEINLKQFGRLGNWFIANARTNMLPIQLASAAEDTLRINSFMSLLDAGVDVKAAVARVNAAHINYHYVSETDRMLRDFVPFVRFRIGTTPQVIGAAINNPKVVLPFSYMLNIMQKAHSGSGAIAPDYLRKSFAIPLDVGEDGKMRFISSFGIIHEEVENLMEPVATDVFDPMRLRRWGQQQGAAKLHPVLRNFIEFISDKNFFRDQPYFAYKKAPHWMTHEGWLSPVRDMALKTGLLKEVKRDWRGNPVYEVTDWHHPLSTTVGLNRLSDEFGKLFDKNLGWWDMVLNVATGIKIKSVNERQELLHVLKKALIAEAQTGDMKEISRLVSTGEASEDLKFLLRSYLQANKSFFKDFYSKRNRESKKMKSPGPMPSSPLSKYSSPWSRKSIYGR